MQVLILDDNARRQQELRELLEAKGVLVLSATSVGEANTFLRRTIADLVILRHWIDGRASLSVALAAEYYNPGVATLLLSDESREDADELFELLPSMTSLLGEGSQAELVARVALSALTSQMERALVLQPSDRAWHDDATAKPPLPLFVSRRGAVTAQRIPA